MKRNQLLKHLRQSGCRLIREGRRHSWWCNDRGDRRSAVPRHREIDDTLARKICRDRRCRSGLGRDLRLPGTAPVAGKGGRRAETDRGEIPEPLPKELLDLGIQEYRELQYDPYRIIYRVLGRNVYVLVIADGRRDMQTLLQRRLLQA